MEILEEEKGQGESREGEEKTYPRIAQCFRCLPKLPETPLRGLIQTWTWTSAFHFPQKYPDSQCTGYFKETLVSNASTQASL